MDQHMADGVPLFCSFSNFHPQFDARCLVRGTVIHCSGHIASCFTDKSHCLACYVFIAVSSVLWVSPGCNSDKFLCFHCLAV